MKLKGKPFLLLLYTIASILYLETVLRLKTASDGFFSQGVGLTVLFALPFALAVFLLCSLFTPGTNRRLAIAFFALFSFLFSSQLMYNITFRTYYSIDFFGMAGEATDFWRETLLIVARNFHWVLAFFAPLIVLVVWGKKWFEFDRIRWQPRTALAVVLVLIQVASVTMVYAGTREPFSPYDLYFQRNYPNLSVERLGLLTTMRLNSQRVATGWTPVLDIPPTSEQPIFPPGKDKERFVPGQVEYNIMDINFKDLYAAETDEVIASMHRYFASVQPTAKNEYTGIYEGYNLIFITGEAFSHLAVHEEVTPTLYKMVHEGYHFTNFYTPVWGASTTDGEYVACTGLIPKSGVRSFPRSHENYLPFVMGNQLARLGYKTMAYHNHTHSYYRRHLSHPNMGYDYKGIGSGLVMTNIWPRSDLEMMEITVPEYIDNEPFHAYYMTVSGHLEYNFFGHAIARRNRHLVEHLPYSDAVRAYLAANIELDKALEHLLNELEEAGIADRTLIVLSSDHWPYGLRDEEIDELAGHYVERHFELHRNALIIYTPGMEPETIEQPASSLDIIPTISNLLGLEFDSRLLMGRDIFSDADPLVIYRCGSFITDKGRYNAQTNKFYPAEHMPANWDYTEYVEEVSAEVNRKFYFSALILDHDYYRILFPDGRP